MWFLEFPRPNKMKTKIITTGCRQQIQIISQVNLNPLKLILLAANWRLPYKHFLLKFIADLYTGVRYFPSFTSCPKKHAINENFLLWHSETSLIYFYFFPPIKEFDFVSLYWVFTFFIRPCLSFAKPRLLTCPTNIWVSFTFYSNQNWNYWLLVSFRTRC